jgi:peptide/nickel transport system ATP-binding protein
MTPPLIELRGVSKQFGGAPGFGARFGLGASKQDGTVRAVDHFDLSVTRNEVVGLVGESGCGKSTVARMVAGIMPPSSGQVFYKGDDIASLPGNKATLAKLRVQMIFQDPYASLNPRMRVQDIVGEAPAVHHLVPRAELAAYVDAQLRQAGLDPALKRRFPHQFSGGQRQRVGLARALATDPGILLMDEPFGALDPLTRAEMQTMLRDLLQRVGKTVLLVTHDLDEALYLAQRVIFIQAGEVVADLPAAEVLHSPNPHVRRYVDAVHRRTPSSLKSAAP